MKLTGRSIASMLILIATGMSGAFAHSAESTEFGVTGTLNADGSFRLDIVPGDFETHALLIFSQPSKTLLVAAMDSGYLGTPRGQALNANIQGAQSYISGDLSQVTPAVLLPQAPPATDANIQILVYGTFEGKQLDGLEVINSRVSTPSSSPTSFGLFARLHLGPGGELDTTVCCKCGDPATNCGCVDDCSTPFCNCIECTMTRD